MNQWGGAAKAIMSIMSSLNTEVVHADYRKILPEEKEVEEIYKNKDMMMKIFQRAKLNAMKFLKDKDCLILSGNNKMVDARLYGKENSIDEIDLARSIAEMALIHVAIEQGMPILGICGGHQILNVYFGGTLQSLSQESIKKQGFLKYSPIKIDPDSELAILMGGGRVKDEQVIERLFGAHRQVVKEVGGKEAILGDKEDYMKVVAQAHEDENIEATEARYGAPVLGLQFHPEVGAKGLPFLKFWWDHKAKTKEDIIKNESIFRAFKQSAITFHNKKAMLAQISKISKDREEIKISYIENNKKLGMSSLDIYKQLKEERDAEIQEMQKGDRVKAIIKMLEEKPRKAKISIWKQIGNAIVEYIRGVFSPDKRKDMVIVEETSDKSKQQSQVKAKHVEDGFSKKYPPRKTFLEVSGKSDTKDDYHK
jgi:gamma-glutamyl-gamma-aminobutyrate hydrolase PuuD